MRRPNPLFVLTTFLCFAGLAGGQVAPGYPTFTPQDCGQYDCINLQNLNVSLNVPVMSKSGALPFSASLVGGDSYFYLGGALATSIEPGLLATPLSPSIDGIFSPFAPAIVLPSTTSSVTCPTGDGTGSADEWTGWYLQMPDGTVHSLPASDIVYGGASCSSTLTDIAIDGSGWSITVNGGTFYNSGQAGVAVVSSGGITFSTASVYPYMEDSQSTPNKITYEPAYQEFVDTLGMEALTVNANAAGQLSWPDTLGNFQTESQTLTSAILKTSFGCSGKTDYPATNYAPGLTTAINFPDSTSIGLSWEPNQITGSDYTGRIAEITLRGGGTIVFNYNPANLDSSSHYNLNCTYMVPNSMTRKTSDGTVTYTWTHTSTGNTTTRVDIGGNETIYTFSGTVLTEVQAFHNTGPVSSPTYGGTPDLQTIYCYNSGSTPTVSLCPTAPVSAPVSELAIFTSPNGLSSAEHYVVSDSYGNVTTDEYLDYGGSSPLKSTVTTYGSWNGSGCSAISSPVHNKPCTVAVYYGGAEVSASEFTYGAHGNLLTRYVSPNGGGSYLSNPTANSYNANGTPATLYDLAGNSTTFSYSSSYYTDCSGCTQYPFPTTRVNGGLTTYAYYNGYGGVKTEDVDANGNDTTYCYNNTTGTTCNGSTGDPWSRILATVDPLGNESFQAYSATGFRQSFTFNGSNSILGSATTVDGYGRVTNVQKPQSPTGSNYDTVSTYRTFPSGNQPYLQVQVTNPCSEPSGTPCGTTYGPTSTFDMFGRPVKSVQTGSNATTQTTYDENDVTTVLSPAPSGENTKGVEQEFDALGRVKSSCAISSVVAGETSCGQKTGSNSGILTTTLYIGDYKKEPVGSFTVLSERHSGALGGQTRYVTTDGLGRVIQKVTPEGGTWTYTYDTNTSCPSGWRGVTGQLASVTDLNGNLLCYSYDSANRVTGINANGTTCRWFYYDNGEGNGTTSGGYTGTVPTGITLSNQYGRMVEAATDSCAVVASHTSSTLTTDLWWAYDKDGHQTAQWESTPNSGGYYEATATFFGNGAVDELTLTSPSITSETYTLDGEGRWNSIKDGASNEQVVAENGVTFNPAGEPTAITLLGVTHSYDYYSYDPNTLRMTQYQFKVGSGSSNTDTGVLTWNPIGSLESLAITDDFNSNGSMTCSYNTHLVTGTGYDDLNRLIGFSCTGTGGTWSQTFAFNDAYDNVTKTGTGLPSWNPGYSPTTNQYTCTGCTNDSNGNVTNDGTNAYTWNAFSKMASVNMSGSGCATNGDCLVYDALGRVVEIDDGSTKEEIWYTQLGKTAYMNGRTYLYGYFPGPGGGTLYNSTACPTCWMHKDWLGNARVVSSTGLTVAVETDRAYAPYGEVFDIFGGTNQPWTMFGGGSTQDMFAGMYDTPGRELQGSQQGRFLSPDPAGSGWNQYAYPTNPNSFIDPTGFDWICGDALDWAAHGAHYPGGPDGGIVVCGDTSDGGGGGGGADAGPGGAGGGGGGGGADDLNQPGSCLYLNDQGIGITPGVPNGGGIDPNSTLGECQSEGGLFTTGTITSFSTDPNGDFVWANSNTGSTFGMPGIQYDLSGDGAFIVLTFFPGNQIQGNNELDTFIQGTNWSAPTYNSNSLAGCTLQNSQGSFGSSLIVGLMSLINVGTSPLAPGLGLNGAFYGAEAQCASGLQQ